MASENETVADIKSEMYGIMADEFGYVNLAQSDFIGIADRIEAANKREVVELRECLKEALQTQLSCHSCHVACAEYSQDTCLIKNRWRKALEGEKDGK